MLYPVYCLTNRNHHWLLPGFCYQADKHWSGHGIIVASFGERPAELPDHWTYRRIAKTNYPANRWTDGLIELCKMIRADYFTLMLEDYWLGKTVKQPVLDAVDRYLMNYGGRDSVLRVDLTADRASKKQARPYMLINDPIEVELIKTPPHTKYQMSFQAGVWNRDLLMACLRRGENPWQAEIDGSKRLSQRKRPLTVLGTEQRPLFYRPVYRSHRREFSTMNTSVGSRAVKITSFPKGVRVLT